MWRVGGLEGGQARHWVETKHLGVFFRGKRRCLRNGAQSAGRLSHVWRLGHISGVKLGS